MSVQKRCKAVRRVASCGRMTLCLACVIAALIGVCCPMTSYEEAPGPKGLISPHQAAESAKNAFCVERWRRGPMSTVETDRLSAGKAMLVQRVDRENAYYYIVPFNAMDLTAAVVLIDARNGRFKECATMEAPEIYPKVNAEQAIRILSAHLNMKAHDDSLSKAQLKMVWKPCEQTQSPYEPLWHIRVDADQWYVDQKGKVHRDIKEITVKGGGPG